jgi:prophage regulatory protein
MPSLRIIKADALCARLGNCSLSYLDDLERQGFPRRIHLSRRSVGWLEHEVDAWIEARMRERDCNQAMHARARPRPPLAAKRREQLSDEAAELYVETQHTHLTEREREGDVWSDAPT